MAHRAISIQTIMVDALGMDPDVPEIKKTEGKLLAACLYSLTVKLKQAKDYPASLKRLVAAFKLDPDSHKVVFALLGALAGTFDPNGELSPRQHFEKEMEVDLSSEEVSALTRSLYFHVIFKINQDYYFNTGMQHFLSVEVAPGLRDLRAANALLEEVIAYEGEIVGEIIHTKTWQPVPLKLMVFDQLASDYRVMGLLLTSGESENLEYLRKAEAVLEKALECYPESPALLDSLGHIHEGLVEVLPGREATAEINKALDLYQIAMELEPDFLYPFVGYTRMIYLASQLPGGATKEHLTEAFDNLDKIVARWESDRNKEQTKDEISLLSALSKRINNHQRIRAIFESLQNRGFINIKREKSSLREVVAKLFG